MQQRTLVSGGTVAGRYWLKFPRWAALGAALTAAILLTACSSQEKTPEATGQVSGKVSVKGRPLTSGVITLLNSGVSWEATLDRSGKFRISAPLPPGDYLVFLRAAAGGTHPQVPGKYQSDTSTDYKATVKPGNNELTIDLK